MEQPASTPPTIETADTGSGGAADPWVQVTQLPCAITASGRLHCWRSSDWADEGIGAPGRWLPVPESTTRFERIWALNAGVVWGVTKVGGVERVFCGAQPPVQTSQSGYCSVPDDEGQQLVELGYHSGLTAEGQLIDWGDGLLQVDWYPVDRTYTMLAFAHNNLALDDTNTLHFGGMYWSNASPNSVPGSYAFPADGEIVEIATLDYDYGCVLDSEGAVTCVDHHGLRAIQPFENGPYQRIRGNFGATCAQRVDHVIECDTGETFDFGPLRDFAVSENRPVTFDEGEVSLELCVLTEQGAIHCVGERYRPDLLEQLPTGDPFLER